MKVALINPPPATRMEMHDVPDHPHIGLAYLSAYIEKKGISCKVIDAKLEKLDLNETIAKILKGNFDIVGLTAFTHDIKQAVFIAEGIKKANPEIKTVIGGVHATALPKETLESFRAFDFLVHGEGELTFLELINAIAKNRDARYYSDINGIAFREGDIIRMTPFRERIDDLDILALPAWHLFPKTRHYSIMSARGCPYSCIFCMSPYGRKKVREMSPKRVIEELEHTISNYSPERYTFNDETFGFNKERGNQILDSMIEKKFYRETVFDASLRANLVTYDFLKKMKKAGFVMVDFGVESGDAEMLKTIKKGVTLEQTENAVKMAKKAGLKVGVNIIIGHPNETKETAKRTIDYAVKLNGDVTAIGLMVPYPGTEVAEMAKKGEGGYKILSLDWSDYNKQVGNALELKTLSRKEMEKLQMTGYAKILLKNYRFIDFIKFAFKYRKAAFRFLGNYFGGKGSSQKSS